MNYRLIFHRLMATKQFLLRLDEKLIAQLTDAAVRFGATSGNQVAAEVIEMYLEFWVTAKEAQQEVFEQQRAALSAPTQKKRSPRKSK